MLCSSSLVSTLRANASGLWIHLERIHIQYLNLIKAKESLPVLHSRILPRVPSLSKPNDGRHVGSERMDCTEWQKIGEKANEWQTLRDEDATKGSWEDVY